MAAVADDDVQITRVYERHACWTVEGVVRTARGWRKASFVVHKPDVVAMSRQDFEAFAKRQLPHVTEDDRYEVAM
jgi:hypothetical protein